MLRHRTEGEVRAGEHSVRGRRCELNLAEKSPRAAMSSLLQGLNEPQRAAVTTVEGPLLVLAGAGTGKTRVVTTRIAHLIHCGTPASEILAVTFTNKAAREMRDRVRGLAEKRRARGLTVSTFHSFAVRLLRRYPDAVGYGENFTILDEDDRTALVRSALRDAGVVERDLAPKQATWIISGWKNAALDPEAAMEAACDEEEILAAHAYIKVQEEMRRRQVIDFDDMIRLALVLLRSQPEIRQALRERFRQVMVDEYQDTNGAQYALLRELVGERPNLCVVGDDDQSIYGWRGARSGNILEFTRDFPGARVVALEQNYRSTNTILGAANDVISNNPARREKALWSQLGDGERIIFYEAADERDEEVWLTSRIQELVEQGMRHEDIAVLLRANAQSRALEVAFRSRDIPYRILGTRSLFDRKEVRDLLAYLRAAINPDDDGSVLRILNTPPRGIGKTTRDRLIEAATKKRRPILQVLESGEELSLTPKIRAAVESFRRLLTELSEMSAKDGVERALTHLLEVTNYEAFMKMEAKEESDATIRWNILQEVVKLAGDPRYGGDATKFLESLALDGLRSSQEDKGGQGVLLVTVHAAKGLEFDNVFIVGVEDGLFPHKNSLGDDETPDTIDEERRLFYVALTRARWRLWMSRALVRQRYGRTVDTEPSRFLAEIVPARMDHQEGLAMEPVDDEAADRYLDKLKSLFGPRG